MDELQQKLGQRRSSVGDLEAFLKSRKTERSPVRKRKDRDEYGIEELIQKMTKDLKEHAENENRELRKAMENNNREIKNMIGDLKEEIAQIKEKEKKWEEDRQILFNEIKRKEEEHKLDKMEVQKLGKRLTDLEKKLEKEEKDKRMTNIIIKGKVFEEEKLVENVNEFIREKITSKAKAISANKIKTRDNEFIVAKIETREQKIEIMKQKWKLRKEESRIYIDDDLTPVERMVQKNIRKIASQERENKKSVKIGYQKIKIEDKWYRWNFEQSTITEIEDKKAKN